MALLEHSGMVLVKHGMVLLEQCVLGLLEHHGAAASGRDNSSCSAASQAMNSKPFLAFLAPLGNPSLLEAILRESGQAPCSTSVIANVTSRHW